jgi:hypothetical protein
MGKLEMMGKQQKGATALQSVDEIWRAIRARIHKDKKNPSM